MLGVWEQLNTACENRSGSRRDGSRPRARPSLIVSRSRRPSVAARMATMAVKRSWPQTAILVDTLGLVLRVVVRLAMRKRSR